MQTSTRYSINDLSPLTEAVDTTITFKENDTFARSSSILVRCNCLFDTLKANPEADASFLCERMIELFPILGREDQKNLSLTFYKWAEKYKIKYPVIFCYAMLLEPSDNFFSEQHQTVLSEGPVLQKAFRENNEPAAAAAIEAFLGSIHRTLGKYRSLLKLIVGRLWKA